MKLACLPSKQGFTLVELMVSISIGLLLLAATVTASVGLQKSFSAADHFFSTHIQQIRIIDYLCRDVKRSVITQTSTDQQTVTCTIPNLLNGNTRRTPVVVSTPNGQRVDYGRLATGATTKDSAIFTSALANFTSADVGSIIAGYGIPDSPMPTTIVAVGSGTTVTLSSPATATEPNVQVSISSVTTVVYAVTGNGQSIVRTENGVVTTIASSTDQLVSKGTDVTDDLRNTEYLDANVTFLTTFAFNPPNPGPSATPDPVLQMKRNGTAIFGRAYLRNKRRG